MEFSFEVKVSVVMCPCCLPEEATDKKIKALISCLLVYASICVCLNLFVCVFVCFFVSVWT